MIIQKEEEAERQPLWTTGALQHPLEPGAIAPLMWIQVSAYGPSFKPVNALWKANTVENAM